MSILLAPKLGTKPKIAIYARVSTMEQVDTGHSLQVQENKMLHFASSNGWEVLEVFRDEGKSARSINRPSFEALLDFCDDRSELLDAVLVQDTSRLCRNVQDHLEVKAFLRKREIKLISLEGNNDDTDEAQFLDLIIAGVNELESKRTSRKTKRIMVSMFEEGFKPGMAPLGYINSFKKGYPMTIDPERAPYVKEIFRLWNTGNYSYSQISREMFKQGFRSKSGKLVCTSMTRHIIKSVEYAGGLEHDGVINMRAKHEPIISIQEHERAQRIVESRNRGADRSRKHGTLLAGLAYCSVCKRLMHGEYHPKGNYYRCPQCKGAFVSMSMIDKNTERFFKGSKFTEQGLQKLREALIEAKDQQGGSATSQKLALEARKKAVDDKMRKLEDKLLFDDVDIDKERIRERYKPLKTEMEQIEDQISKLSESTNKLSDQEVDKIIWGMGRMGTIYNVLTKEQKKQFLKYFIKKVFVDIKAKKIVDYELVPEFEALLSRDLVRISFHWLRR